MEDVIGLGFRLMCKQFGTSILHIRRHLAATPLFKGLPDFKQLRIAMLRAETVDELFDIFEKIKEQYG